MFKKTFSLCMRWLMLLGLLSGLPSPSRASEPLLIPEGEPFSAEQVAQLVQIQLSRVEILAYDEKGETLASGEENGRVCLWDIERRFPRRCLAAKKGRRVTAIRFSPQDDWLAVGYADGSVELHQREGKSEPCELPPLDDKIAIGRTITALHFTSGGGLLAIGAKRGALRQWHDVLSRDRDRCIAQPATAQVAVEDFPTPLIESTALDRAGRLLAVSFGGSVGVWELAGGRKLWLSERLPEGGLAVELALSPDGTALAVGMLDGTVLGFDAQTGRRLPSLGESPHKHSKIHTLSFSPDGQQIAVGADDRTLSIWRALPLRAVESLPRQSAVTAVAFSPRGTGLAVASEDVGVALYNPLQGYEKTPSVLSGNVSAVRALATSQTGQRLATVSENREVRIWERRALDGQGSPWALRCPVAQQPEYLTAVAFAAGTSNLLATAGDGRRIRLWDTSSCRGTEAIESPHRDISALAFSKDGRFLVAGSDDGLMNVYDLGKKQWRENPLRGHRDGVLAVAFSPSDDTLVASGSYDKTARLWNVATGALIHSFPVQGAGVRRLAFSEDGALLAAAMGPEVVLWRLSDRSETGRLSHAAVVTGIAFLRDGSLVSADQGGTLRSWDVATRQERSKFGPSPSADGQAISAISLDLEHNRLFVASGGRIVERNVGELSQTEAELWQGPDGWAAIDRGSLYRHESGNLLWRKLDRGVLVSVSPQESFPTLKLTQSISESNREASPHSWGTTIRVDVTNASEAKAALWLRWRLRLADGASLPLGVWANMPDPMMRLAPQETRRNVQIPIALHWNEKLAPLPPQGTLDLLVEVATAGGAVASLPVTVQLAPAWWPLFRQYKLVLLLLSPHRATLAIAGLLLCAVGLLLRRQRLMSTPLVQAVRQGLSPVEGKRLLEFQQLSKQLSEGAFRSDSLRDQALQNAGLDANKWNRIVDALKSPKALASLLAESLVSQLDQAPLLANEDLAVFRMALPNVSLHLPESCTLIVCLSKDRPVHRFLLDIDPKLLPREGVLLIADATSNQAGLADVRDALRHIPGDALRILFAEDTIRQILFAQDSTSARREFCRAVVTQVPVARLSPFRSSGTGIEDAYHRSFLGREGELQQLLAGVRQNFLLVGPRRMGKSSLLKAFRRELLQRMPDVEITTFCFGSTGSLSGLFRDHADFPTSTPDAFHRSILARSAKHQVYLLDEVDYFLDVEKRSDYPFCSVMRALSVEGRASFVLSGHREVHAALRTSEHPLRNFGHKLLLGPLDREAAAQMILAPLTDFGLSFADSHACLDWIRDQTACRPHLLSFIGDALLRLREPYSNHPLSLSEVREAVLSAHTIKDDLGNWDSSTGTMLIEGMILRCVLLMGPTTLVAVRAFLQDKGVMLSKEQLRQSIYRVFDMHYGLILEPSGKLHCPLPLLEYHLSNPLDAPSGRPWPTPIDRLRDELERDVRNFLAQG